MTSPLFEPLFAVSDGAGTEPTSHDTTALDALLNDRHPIIEATSAWAADHLEDLDRGIDRDRWRVLADAGFQRLTVPVSDGGLGRSTVEAMLAFEGLGHGCSDNGLVFALASQVFATQNAIRSAASGPQLATHLPGLLDGSTFGAFARTDPGAGSDSSAITTIARRVDADADDPKSALAEYELTGEKCWITLGPIADLVVVFATTDPSLGRWGITAFAVETSREGITCGERIEKLGLDSSPFGSVSFDRCRVTFADRLGPEGGGGGVFTKAVEGERAFLFAGQLGATRRVIEQSIARARSREQFGSVIGANQAVSHRIADMKLHHEAGRLLVYKAAALNDRGRSVGMAAALAKLQTSEMAVQAALDAISLHGAEGYTTGLPLERELRDAIGGLAYSGTSDIQRMIIARLLRVDTPLRRTSEGRSTQSELRPQDPSATKHTRDSTSESLDPGENS